MFSCLNPQELDIVLGAMQYVKKQPSEVIIKEGDDGDNLYVVESGVLTCTKHFVRYLSTYYFRKETQSQPSSRNIIQVKPLESLPSSTMPQEQLQLLPSQKLSSGPSIDKLSTISWKMLLL